MLVYLSVMPRGNKLTVKGIRTLEQRPPFDMRIAHHAWIRRSSSQVFIYKILNDKVPKFIPDIKDKMRKSMLHCSHAGIIETIQIATACFFFGGACSGIIPCFH